MQYRSFGKKISFRPSALGFGCMRLPTTGTPGAIDEPEATRMLRYAIDQGINYIDTAYPYHEGNSEKWLGRALKDGYCDKVKLATKLPTWLIDNASDFDRYFEEQCTRLQTETIDFYLVHNLQEKLWPVVRDVGICDWLLEKRDQGRIGSFGFSFHGRLHLFKSIIEYCDEWHFCQIQYNYMNEHVQAGTEGLVYAASKGLGIVVMEPLLGGCLARPPKPVQQVWDNAAPPADPVSKAFEWLWHIPEVSVVLSGMSEMAHVEQNLALAASSICNKRCEDDLELIQLVKEAYECLNIIPCTNCGYCLPCPEGVDIPVNFEYYNSAITFGGVNLQLNKALYGHLEDERRASSCKACGTCEDQCPQEIAISEWMPEVNKALSTA